MGYITNYSLEIKPRVPDNFGIRFSEVTHGYDVDDLYGIKWYDHDEHMLLLSDEYPDCFFILSGEGEASEDIWKTYYYRGKANSTSARIVYDDPDFEKLGNPHIHSPELFI